LGLSPNEVMMVAAHLDDLRGAKAVGLKTAFVPRPSEVDITADPDFDVVATDFLDLGQTTRSLSKPAGVAMALLSRGLFLPIGQPPRTTPAATRHQRSEQ